MDRMWRSNTAGQRAITIGCPHWPPISSAAWRRPPRDLVERLCCRYTRTVARDNTVRLSPRWTQIPRGPHGRSYAGCRVEVRECLDGRLLVDYQGRRLATAPAPAGDFVLIPRRAQRLRAAKSASDAVVGFARRRTGVKPT